ncbi:MAG: hypothetical protein ACTHZ1_06520 [Sphingobacterium sp.]
MGIFTYFKQSDKVAQGDSNDLTKETVMVGIFRTNVNHSREAADLIAILQHLIRPIMITFDLEDCDRILRVEAETFDTFEIINTVNVCGFNCELLD